MNVRRREALGRNRGGPPTTNTVSTLLLLGAALVVLGGLAFRYLTQPQRVFGHKQLDCPIHKIEWTTNGEVTVIRGCGRQVEAYCADECYEDRPHAAMEGDPVVF